MPRKAPPAPRGALRIEIVSQRLRGGRLNISARTHSAKERDARELAVRALLTRDPAAVDRLRRGELRVEDVALAYSTGEWGILAPAAAVQGSAPEPLLGDEIDSYLQSVKATAKKASTVARYETLAAVVLEAFPRATPMRSVTLQQAEEFLHGPKGKNEQPWAASTQLGYASFLAGLWDRVIEREADAADVEGRDARLTRNPWKRKKQGGIRLPKKARTRFAWLRQEQWRQLSEATRGTPRRALMALGVLAGLRQQEAATLRTREDVDLERALIHVRGRGGERPWEPKTERSTRTVPMCAELVEIIREHIALGFAGETYLLRTSRWDRKLSATTIISWTRESLEAIGVPYGRGDRESLTNHSFRHTFATWLLQGNEREDGSLDSVDVMRVAELLGDSADMVIEVYGHLIPRNLRQAIGVLDRKLVQR